MPQWLKWFYDSILNSNACHSGLSALADVVSPPANGLPLTKKFYRLLLRYYSVPAFSAKGDSCDQWASFSDGNVSGRSQSDRANIIQWTADSGTNQQWNFPRQ